MFETLISCRCLILMKNEESLVLLEGTSNSRVHTALHTCHIHHEGLAGVGEGGGILFKLFYAVLLSVSSFYRQRHN